MLTREDTFDTDMKALWEARFFVIQRTCQVCETATKPSGFLMVKIGEMESLGTKIDEFRHLGAEERLFHRCWQAGPGQSEVLRGENPRAGDVEVQKSLATGRQAGEMSECL